MKKLLLLFITISALCQAQNEAFVYPSFVGQEFDSIQKNKNWTILRQTTGNLNADEKEDMVIVLESKEAVYEQRYAGNDLEKHKARIILVLLSKDGKRIVHTQNNKFIARAYESNYGSYIEPLLYIEDRELIISNVYVSASQSYSFQFKDNDFFITGANAGSVHDTTYIQKEYDFIHQKLITTKGLRCQDEGNASSIEFKATPKSLSEFNAMYEWEVIPGHFL